MNRKSKWLVIAALSLGWLFLIAHASSNYLSPEVGLEDFTESSTTTVPRAEIDSSTALRPPKGNPKLESSLNQLVQTYHQRGIAGAWTFSKSRNIILQDGRVQVTIVTTQGAVDEVRDAVKTAGGVYQLHYRNLVQVLVPIGELEVLAQRPDVEIIREPRRPIPPPGGSPAGKSWVETPPLPMAGTQTSQGVVASNASAWQAEGYDGTGVRVAVIDVDFLGYTSLLGSDLPGSVTTYDWPGFGMETISTHGTACAEVVYDMAPGVGMDLHKIGTEVEFGNAVDQAIIDEVDIITASIGWMSGGPGDGTGSLSDIVNEARTNGVFYAAAAGNSSEHCWSGTFTDTDGDDVHEWAPNGQEINYFGPGDGSAWLIRAGFPIEVNLHWDDWAVVDQDYDLELYYLSGAAWEYVTGSYNNQAEGYPTPEENIYWISLTDGVYGVVVLKESATRDVCLRILANGWGPDLDERVPARSLIFPADSPDAVTVGAVDVNKPYHLEGYSSRGPTFGHGGTCSGGGTKPDIVAYANVDTVSWPGAFFGTSAATPHVAGAAALVKDINPSFTVDQLQDYLETCASDLGNRGKDNLYGSGRLYLPALRLGWVSHKIRGPDKAGYYTISGIINIENNGDGPSPQGTLWVYVSETEDPDILIVEVPISPLQGWKTIKKRCSRKVMLPTDSRYLYLIATAEAGGQDYGPALLSLDGGVDLTGEWISLIKTGPDRREWYKVKGNCLVENMGYLAAGSFEAQVYYSPTGALDGSETAVLKKPKRIPKLRPGKPKKVRFNWKTDEEPIGTFFLVVDEVDAIDELDDVTNNVIPYP